MINYTVCVQSSYSFLKVAIYI